MAKSFQNENGYHKFALFKSTTNNARHKNIKRRVQKWDRKAFKLWEELSNGP